MTGIDLEKKIHKFLKKNEGWYTSRQIADKLKVERKAVGNRLNNLLKHHQVYQEEVKNYYLWKFKSD